MDLIGGGFNVNNAINMTGAVILWILVIGLLLAVSFFFGIQILNYFRYNIRVMIYRVINGVPNYREDWARQYFNKKDNMMSFKLKKLKVDLASIVDKTSIFVPSKRPFTGYCDAIMLMQNGPDDQLDSYSVIDPSKFIQGIQNDYNFDSVLDGATRQDWVMFEERRRKEYEQLEWWQNPQIIGNFVFLFAIIIVVVIFIFGGKMMNEMIAQASGFTGEGTKMLQEAKEVLQTVALSCGKAQNTPLP